MPEALKIDGKMNVHIFCPTHVVVDTVADKVLLPVNNGNMMILKGRAPLFTSVKAGILWIYNKGFEPQAYYIDDGIAEIRRNICSVIAWGIKADEIDCKVIHQKRMRQQERLSKTHSKIQKEQLEKAISFLKMLEERPQSLTAPNFE